MASGRSGVSRGASGTLLHALLTALTAIRRFGEVEDMAGIVVTLPITVFHHQDLDPAEPAGEVPAALDRRLRPQRRDLQQWRIV
jgi:hypothetical protein